VPKGELKSLLSRDLDGGVFDEALASLLVSGAVELRGDRLLPPGAGPSLSEADRQVLERIEQRLAGQGFQPPELSEVLRGVPRESRPTELVRHMIESGRAVKVTSELVYTRAQWEEIERRVAAHFARNPRLGMGDFKGYLQISRKYAVPLLEHLDRLGITRREGDERIPGPKLKK
jgi:selenocysteine-specific elongation factor